MIPDVYINDISMLELGWIRESIDFPIPKPQLETVVVPGRNSPIRFTEALGLISYEPRVFSITLSMLGTRDKFNALVRETSNQFSAKLVKVICSEEPDLYCVGTLEIKSSYDSFVGRGELIIECNDADSYRYHAEETEVIVSGSKTVVLTNDYMPVVPVVITTENTKLTWSIGTDSFSKVVSSGTWEIPELQLSKGNNSITITSSGITTFRYREGCL